MSHPSDDRLLVLHGLRLKGFAEAADVSALTGVDPDAVEETLAKAAADGHAVRRDGPRLRGWSLTADGRTEQERLLAEELVAAGAEAAVRASYRSFLALNAPMLSLCTDWQMIDDTTINDHHDRDHDRAVVERLLDHHAAALPVLEGLESALDRYGHYRPRFDHAIERLEAGDDDWFTKPMIDSYHTIWFQLHEDLLNTLGIERSKEAVS